MNSKNKQKQVGIIDRQIEKIRYKYRNYEAKEIIRRIILIIIPVSFPFTWFFFSNLISLYFFGKGGYGVEGALILFFTLIPIYSLVYGIGTLKVKRKNFFAWYNSVSSVGCVYVSSALALSKLLFGGFLKYTSTLFSWVALWTFLPIWIHSLKTKHPIENDGDKAPHDCDVIIHQSDITNSITNPKQCQENKDLPEAFLHNRNSLKQTIKTILQIVVPIFLPSAWKHFASFMISITNTTSEEINLNIILISIITFFSIYCSIYGLFSIKCKKRKYLLWYNVIATIICFCFSSASGWQYSIAKSCIKEHIFLFFYFLAFCTFLPVWIYKARNKHG